MKIRDLTGKLVALMPTGRSLPLKIDVKQRGLATGQVVPVRRVKRVHIKVKYIPS